MKIKNYIANQWGDIRLNEILTFKNHAFLPQTTDTNMCQKGSELRQDNSLNEESALRLQKTYRNHPHTCYRYPVKPVLLNGMQNLSERQLSSVCLVEPFWLAVK
jgi:hypothetical protein